MDIRFGIPWTSRTRYRFLGFYVTLRHLQVRNCLEIARKGNFEVNIIDLEFSNTLPNPNSTLMTAIYRASSPVCSQVPGWWNLTHERRGWPLPTGQTWEVRLPCSQVSSATYSSLYGIEALWVFLPTSLTCSFMSYQFGTHLDGHICMYMHVIIDFKEKTDHEFDREWGGIYDRVWRKEW